MLLHKAIFFWHIPSSLVDGDGSCDKILHGESEAPPVKEFDFPSQSGGLYDADAPLNPLPSKSGEDDDSQSGTDNDDIDSEFGDRSDDDKADVN